MFGIQRTASVMVIGMENGVGELSVETVPGSFRANTLNRCASVV